MKHKVNTSPWDLSSLSRRDFVAHSLKSSLALAAVLATASCGRSKESWIYDSHFEEYARHDAVGLARLVKRGHANPLELLEIAIARAEVFNPEYNFMAVKLYEYARTQLKRQTPQGDLAGVPFLLKDLSIHLKDTPMTFGSRFFQDFVSNYDSTLAKRYKDAGLVMFGRTTSPEFGSSITTESILHGATRNPWNKELSPGGSSGGSAAAIALGVVPAAHASDGGGSIRIPASACGLFGLKPSRGRTPYGPYAVEASGGLSIMHVISRTVRDSAAFLDISVGPEPGLPYTVPAQKIPYLVEVKRDPGKLKIGVMNGEGAGLKVEEDCLKALEHARRLCEDLGHNTVAVPWPDDLNNVPTGDILGTLMGTEGLYGIEAVEKQLGREVKQDELELVNWWQVKRSRTLNATQYLTAKRDQVKVAQIMHKAYGDYDMVLSPTMAALPPKLGTVDTSQNVELVSDKLVPFAVFTAPFNISGDPAMSVPLYWNKDNLPVGVMFSAHKYEEGLLYRLAAQLEEACPWVQRRPV